MIHLVDRSAVGKLEVSGPDATEYLQAHLTADVAALAPGAGREAAMLSPKGMLLAVARVLRTDDGFWLDCEREGLDGLRSALDRGRIGWRVELADRTAEQGELAVLGPAPIEVPQDLHAHREIALDDVPARVIRTAAGADLVGAADRLAAALRDRGAQPAGEELWDRVRVEAGRPRYGRELDDRTLPGDAGLVGEIVAVDKGLYPGLQTTLRQHHRGTSHRALRGLRPEAPVAAGDEVLAGDAAVGRIGTAVVSPERGPLALAILRRSAEPGSTVTVGAQRVPAVVEELPWRWLDAAATLNAPS